MGLESSLAVAHEFVKDPDQHWSNVIEQIALSVEAQHLKLGEHGEDLARTLLSFARDKAFAKPRDKRKAQKTEEKLFGCTYISVTEFLQQLLGIKLESDITAKSWADTHWINFTHFFRRSELFTPERPAPATLLVEAFTRQAAVLGVSEYQDNVHHVIPAYFSSGSAPSGNFIPSHVDVLAIQVKNILFPSISLGGSEAHEDFYSCYLPVSNEEAERCRVFNLYMSLAARPTKTVVSSKASGSPCVLVEGCTADQYPLIGQLKGSAASKLGIFLGRTGQLVEEMKQRFGDGTYTAACFSGREFAMEDAPWLNTSKKDIVDEENETDKARGTGGQDEARVEGEAGREEANKGTNKRKRNTSPHDAWQKSESDKTRSDIAAKKLKRSS